MVCRPDDGLAVDWTGKRVWCNPPYGREAVPFLRKMAGNAAEGGGIALIFARTDTTAWQEHIFPVAHGILFLRGRLRFHTADGTQRKTATAPSALVAYSARDFARLRESGLAGALVTLRTRGFYLGRVSSAQRCLKYACTKLQDFKKFVLPSVWPVNRRTVEK